MLFPFHRIRQIDLHLKTALDCEVLAQTGVQVFAGEVVTGFQGDCHERVTVFHRRDIRLDQVLESGTLVLGQFAEPVRQVGGEGCALALLQQMGDGQVSGGMHRYLQGGSGRLRRMFSCSSRWSSAAEST